MRDEQVERLLAEVKQSFGESELHRKMDAFQRLMRRVIPQIQDRDEGEVLVMLLQFARAGFAARMETYKALVRLLGESGGGDGPCYPPPTHEIARRLAVRPDEVEAACKALIAAGFLIELRPKGFIRRQRRFRLIPSREI